MAADKKTKSTAKPKKTGTKIGEDQQPGFALEKLYLKDVSVEVPNAPEIFTIREQPKTSIELNNETKPLSAKTFKRKDESLEFKLPFDLFW